MIFADFNFQEALKHLSSIDLIELCNEAKIERCRAARDLRSCGRNVQNVLNSCGHASLCDECSQRCDLCPICRVPILKNGDRLQRRLYTECVEAGLISRRCEEMFHDIEDGENHSDDVERLYSFFDVALENGLVSVICHCILFSFFLFYLFFHLCSHELILSFPLIASIHILLNICLGVVLTLM